MPDRHAGRSFPSTLWSELRPGDDPRRSLDALAERYWPPIHAYLRSALSLPEDEAADVTQGFFQWIIESGFLAKARPEKGRFRGFVKSALRNYVIDSGRRRSAAKRGGGRAPTSLDDSLAAPPAPAARESGPEQALDASWREEVMARAVDRTRRSLEVSGREKVFKVFERYFLDPGDELEYADVAVELEITRTDVSNYLMRAKRAYRQALRDVVAETVDDADELEAEMEWLIGGES